MWPGILLKGSSQSLNHVAALCLSLSGSNDVTPNPSLHRLPKEPASKRTDVRTRLEKVPTVLCPVLAGFPPPVLEIEDTYPLAGTAVNVTCSGHMLTSPSPTLRLQGSLNLSAPGEPAWLLFTAREEDDGRTLSCEASLEVQGQRLVKTTESQLHVLCE